MFIIFIDLANFSIRLREMLMTKGNVMDKSTTIVKVRVILWLSFRIII